MTAANSWRLSQKVAFRFFFLLLGMSTVFCWDLLFLVAFDVKKNFTKPYEFLTGPFHWLDRHFYHTGYDPAKHEAFPQDNHFAVVFYLTFLLVAVAGTIIWTILDRKRPGYNKAMYWLRVYLRYTLAIILFFYGIDKVIPIQMPDPGAASLLTPLGENGRFNVLWNFMGISPGYMILTGCCELLASLLLINRRTCVLGYLLSGVVLVNVVAINIFYNVPVKMFSTQLLVYTLFLLYPYLQSLSNFFLFGETVSLKENKYGFTSRWKQRSLLLGLIVIPLLLFLVYTGRDYQRYIKNKSNDRQQKIYEIKTFITKDTLQPLLTDTIRWKRLVFSNRNQVVIFNMQDSRDYYDFDIDSIKKTITLHDNPDTLTWHVFHFVNPGPGQYSLTGKWKGQSVQVFMNSVSIDSFAIKKEKSLWVNDD